MCRKHHRHFRLLGCGWNGRAVSDGVCGGIAEFVPARHLADLMSLYSINVDLNRYTLAIQVTEGCPNACLPQGSTKLTMFCYHFPEAKDMPISTIQTLKLLQLVRTGMVKMDDKVNHIASQVHLFTSVSHAEKAQT